MRSPIRWTELQDMANIAKMVEIVFDIRYKSDEDKSENETIKVMDYQLFTSLP